MERMAQSRSVIFLLVLLCIAKQGSTFSVNHRFIRQSAFARYQSTDEGADLKDEAQLNEHLAVAVVDESDEEELQRLQSEAKTEVLVFSAKTTSTSDPLEDATLEEIAQFLEDPNTRKKFLSAGDTRSVEEIPLTPQLLELWRKTCEDYGPEYLPVDGDTLVGVEATLKFTGVTLENLSCSGAKQRKNESDRLPIYEYVFIGEKLYPKGVFAWLFKRLLGMEKFKDTDAFTLPDGRAISTIAVVPVDGSYAFRLSCNYESKILFPKSLLRVFPISKDKVEAQVSNVLRTKLEEDSALTMPYVRELFLAQRTAA